MLEMSKYASEGVFLIIPSTFETRFFDYYWILNTGSSIVLATYYYLEDYCTIRYLPTW